MSSCVVISSVSVKSVRVSCFVMSGLCCHRFSLFDCGTSVQQTPIHAFHARVFLILTVCCLCWRRKSSTKIVEAIATVEHYEFTSVRHSLMRNAQLPAHERWRVCVNGEHQIHSPARALFLAVSRSHSLPPHLISSPLMSLRSFPCQSSSLVRNRLILVDFNFS